MRISVITATKNLIEAGRAETFSQTVASVKDQSGVDVEHLVIDGGSTDGTPEFLASLGVEAVSEPDRGAYDGMNRGAARAKGAYLLFLNSDDYLHRSDGLALVDRAIADNPDFVAAPVVCLGEDGQSSIAKVSRFYARILHTMPFCHQGLVMRRDLFERLGGFDLRFQIVADYDLVLRMFLAGAKGRRLSVPFATFRPGGLSSDRERLRLEHQQVWAKNLPGYEKGAADLPRAVLTAVARAPDIPSRLRWIARWHLLKSGRGK